MSRDLIAYPISQDMMGMWVKELQVNKNAPGHVWFLEHSPLYTAGTSANIKDLLEQQVFDVYPTGRGGQYTYHGPGQRVVYLVLNLKKHCPDIKKYIYLLEEILILTLQNFGITGERRIGRIGVWVTTLSGDEKKIAAIGVRVSKWITSHGFCLNVDPDLTHYQGIVPCGIKDYGVTSLKDLGLHLSMEEVDICLKQNLEKMFGGLEYE